MFQPTVEALQLPGYLDTNRDPGWIFDNINYSTGKTLTMDGEDGSQDWQSFQAKTQRIDAYTWSLHDSQERQLRIEFYETTRAAVRFELDGSLVQGNLVYVIVWIR